MGVTNRVWEGVPREASIDVSWLIGAEWLNTSSVDISEWQNTPSVDGTECPE